MSIDYVVNTPLNDSFSELFLKLSDKGFTADLLGMEYAHALIQKPARKPIREDLRKLMKFEKDEYQWYLRSHFTRLAENPFDYWFKLDGAWSIKYAPQKEINLALERFKYDYLPWKMEHAVLDLLNKDTPFESLGRAVLAGAKSYAEHERVKFLPYVEYNAIYSAIQKEAARLRVSEIRAKQARS